MQKSKKILVTGGAGFIGSYVVETLLSAGYKVRVFDLVTSQGDVRKKSDWRKALKGIDAVIHLAAYMDRHPDVSTYVDTNVKSIALLFECIAKGKLPIHKVIVASSQSVYGQGKYQCTTHGEVYPPLRSEEALAQGRWEVLCPLCGKSASPLPEEETDQLFPQSPYGISKRASEELLLNLGKQAGIPTVALRYSIVLGPRQSLKHFYSGALRAFTVNALSGEPMQMNEDGKQTRDFVGVEDVARAHLAVLQDARADFKVFNVGSGETTKIIDLARIVSEEAKVPFNPSLAKRFRIGDARHQTMDIRALRALGWSPRQSLREVISAYVAWVKKIGYKKETLARNYRQLKREGVLRNW